MRRSLNSKLAECYEWYERMAQSTDPDHAYSAIKYLSLVVGSLPALKNNKLRREWLMKIEGDKRIPELLDDAGLAAIANGMRKSANRVRHILSIGDIWNDDEILLLLTIRVDLEAMTQFLTQRGVAFEPVPVEDIDAKLEQVKRSPKNREDYRIAAGLMRKNGLPIGARWTSVD